MKSPALHLPIAVILLVAGCASAPTGPSVMTLPGSTKSFEQFRTDDGECRRYAKELVSGTSAVDVGVRNAAIGTVVGAAAGAALGGHEGAAVGAGTGLVVGSMSGAGAAQSSAYGSQRAYDNAYIQCMYAKGHQVPVSAAIARSRTQAPVENPPVPSANFPPPPPGSAPPPKAR